LRAYRPSLSILPLRWNRLAIPKSPPQTIQLQMRLPQTCLPQTCQLPTFRL
jgi:hypothetical protein